MEKVRLVFFPSPGAGHLGPMVELARVITLRHPHISITIFTIDLLLPHGDSPSTPPLPPTPSVSFLHLPLPPNPQPFNPDVDYITNMCRHIDSFSPLLEEAVANLSSSPDSPPVAAFVLDMFCTSFAQVAKDMGLPSYLYFTSGAAFLGLAFHFPHIIREDNHSFWDIPSDPDIIIPSYSHPVPLRLFPMVLLERRRGSIEIFLKICTQSMQMDGVLINTFDELEPYAMSSLVAGEKATTTTLPPVYAVGPVLNQGVGGGGGDAGGGGSSSKKREEIMGWLDRQPECSVVFFCFGSMGCFPAEQVREIANGVERSGHRFLLSLRAPPAGEERSIAEPREYEAVEEVLPEGFLGRTEKRGKVIGWAPQREILEHGAVGGFVSHCGWNSTLESLWCGVPMATWPMYAEQQMNAFLLVREVGAAVEVRMDYKKDTTRLVTAGEIERGIRGLMEDGGGVRAKARELREKGRASVAEGGSSYCSLNSFVQRITTAVAQRGV